MPLAPAPPCLPPEAPLSCEGKPTCTVRAEVTSRRGLHGEEVCVWVSRCYQEARRHKFYSGYLKLCYPNRVHRALQRISWQASTRGFEGPHQLPCATDAGEKARGRVRVPLPSVPQALQRWPALRDHYNGRPGHAFRGHQNCGQADCTWCQGGQPWPPNEPGGTRAVNHP